jgi:hypothetical protein
LAHEPETPTRQKKSSQRTAQQQKEVEVFTSGGRKNLFKKSSQSGLDSPSKRSPGSTDGRQSLQMAGSEQMNFLIATSYTVAKGNLDQYKQQVPSTYHNMTGGKEAFPSNWKAQTTGESHQMQNARMLHQEQHHLTMQA